MRWFDNLMAFFNFSDTTAVFIYFGGLFAIIVSIPLAIVLLIIMMIRRKKKKNKKNEKSVS